MKAFAKNVSIIYYEMKQVNLVFAKKVIFQLIWLLLDYFLNPNTTENEINCILCEDLYFDCLECNN